MTTTNEHTERADLKPCPFCGHTGLDFSEGSTFRWIVASCSECGASRGETRIQTLGEGTKDEWMAEAQADAIRKWNQRAAMLEAQPAREWVGLTEDEVTTCHSAAVLSKRHDGTDPSFTTLLHRQIESKLREKNAGLPAADDKALGYAKRLAQSMWEAEYKNTVPNWQVADDLLTVLTQIDNMASGLCRKSDDKAGVEPVASIYMALYGNSVGIEFGHSAKHYRLDDRWLCIEFNSPEHAIAARDALKRLNELARPIISPDEYTHPQPQAEVRVPDQEARFKAQHQFLEWNRQQDGQLVEVSYEYFVFNKAIDLYLAAAAPKPQDDLPAIQKKQAS